MNTLEIGKKGEELVAAHLARNGFTIIGRNYRQRQGEIDVIGRTGDLVVFVEVKLRQSNYFDQTTIITKSKQKKIITTAKYFVHEHRLFDVVCRFDVAFVQMHDKQTPIMYLEDAFRDGDY